MPSPLTIAKARDLEYEDLVNQMTGLVEQFAAGEDESEEERHDRIARTLDLGPDIYLWLLTLESFFDHWTDFYGGQGGTTKASPFHTEYKVFRQKRDAAKRTAAAMKIRYEGASRRWSMISQEREQFARGRS